MPVIGVLGEGGYIQKDYKFNLHEYAIHLHGLHSKTLSQKLNKIKIM
jgi:hypothetical protein